MWRASLVPNSLCPLTQAASWFSPHTQWQGLSEINKGMHRRKKRKLGRKSIPVCMNLAAAATKHYGNMTGRYT